MNRIALGKYLHRAVNHRRGAATVLTLILLMVLITALALTVDVGYMATIRTELARSADAAAFAGAGELVRGSEPARATALRYLAANPVGGRALTAADATVECGHWDTNSRSFSVSDDRPSAIRVVANSGTKNFFFGHVYGPDDFALQASAIAMCQPRDIVLVLDYSGSMCFDSQFRNISLLGQAAIESGLLKIHQQMGSPTYGTLAWAPMAYGSQSTSTSSVISHFNLNSVTYPFPGGSWNDFIEYVQDDSQVNAGGYRCKYGMLTFWNYVLAKQTSYASTPGLWQASEQPLTALKDAVDVFLSYLTEHSVEDRVGLSLYTYSDQTAILESPLTSDFAAVASICRHRQAGHYVSGTNISAGMTKARQELLANARPGAKRIMVVMTDGVVNLPTGNTTTDKNKVIEEANLAAAAKIPIITIALGAYADASLMQQVADITRGGCFIVPGGQPIADVKEQLEEVFGIVAASRPLKLVE
jgi:hypothetical protein